jgi:cytochrome c oxidase subunit II
MRNLVWTMLVLGIALAADPGQAGGHKLYILDPSTSYNREVTSLMIWVMAFAALVFVTVTAAMVYVTFKFRKTGKETGEPPQFHGNDTLEVAWTIVPTVIVLIIFGLTAASMFKLDKPVPGAMVVDVRAWQFWWDFSYPELGIRTSNELVVPVDKPILFQITGGKSKSSYDVIHSFRITSLVGTQDAIPGIITKITVTPEKIGDYYGQCVELCGASHSNMRFRLKVVSQADFDRFVAGAKAFKPPVDTKWASGQALFQANCAACHTVNAKATEAQLSWPDLSFYGNRTTVGAGVWPNKPQYLERWILNSPGMKPGSKMPAFPKLSQADAKAIGEFLMAHKIEGLDFSALPKY